MLAETITIKTVSETDTAGIFEIEGLYTGYGLTIGNALRRVLISSLPGAAVTRIKIKGINHEFSALPGMIEDIVELSLNIKRLRFRIHTDESQTLMLKARGERDVTARDIESTAHVEVINPNLHLATLTTKAAELDIELTVERGLGYVPVEVNKSEKLPIGVIAVDAIFTPVTQANFVVENMRVGDRTDYNRLTLTISTDGTLTPSTALQRATTILQEHYAKVSSVEVRVLASVVEEPADTKTPHQTPHQTPTKVGDSTGRARSAKTKKSKK